MKKFFFLLVALATLSTANATLILHEDFNRTAGQNLASGVIDNIGTNTTDWWTYSSGSNNIQVVAGTLSYAGYVSTGKGNKAALAGNGVDDLRKFAAQTSGKVYAAAIINVATLNTSTSGFGTTDFFTLGDGENSGRWCRLHGESVKNGDEYVGYKLGIEKYGEATVWADSTFATNTDVLVVLEYEFVAGEKNDIVRLYISPTATTKAEDADAVCDATKAATKVDASQMAALYLYQTTKTPTLVYIDEIKVATAWADLFEEEQGGGETPKEPELNIVITDFDADEFVIGETYTAEWTVSGKNLTADITLTSTSEHMTFNPAIVTKEDAMAEGGKKVTVTYGSETPTEDGWNGLVTITLTSGETKLEKSIYSMYINAPTPEFANLGDAIAAAKAAENYLECIYTGKATITYTLAGQWSTSYIIEDKTGALSLAEVYLYDAEWIEIVPKIGDVISNFSLAIELTNGETVASGIEPTISEDPADAITPAEVTLAELAANGEKYLNRLVVVKNITINQTNTAFATGSIGNEITQGTNSGWINLPAGNPLIDTTKPTYAFDVIGVSSSKAGNVIRPRTAADIVEHTATGIEAATFDAETEIYTIQGMRVESLQPGVNIIRKGNTVYKVVR